MAAPVSTTADRRTARYLLPFSKDRSFCCSLPPEPSDRTALSADFNGLTWLKFALFRPLLQIYDEDTRDAEDRP
jgi:hypothetical protein